MRQGQFELLIIGESSIPFAEEVIDNSTFVYGEPTKVYHVQINIYKDENGKFPWDYLRLGLFVDGVDVQYWKRLDLTNLEGLGSFACSKFWGFKQNANEIRSFVFSEVSTDQTTVHYCKWNGDVGSIKLVIFRAAIESGYSINRSGEHAVPHSTRIIGEKLKVFDQPSVSTVGGNIVDAEKEKFLPTLPNWINIDVDPIATLALRYHTKSMINMLKSVKVSSNNLSDGRDQQTVKNYSLKRSLSSISGSVSTLAEESEKGNDDEVQLITPSVHVDFIDLTQEDSKWTTIPFSK